MSSFSLTCSLTWIRGSFFSREMRSLQLVREMREWHHTAGYRRRRSRHFKILNNVCFSRFSCFRSIKNKNISLTSIWLFEISAESLYFTILSHGATWTFKWVDFCWFSIASPLPRLSNSRVCGVSACPECMILKYSRTPPHHHHRIAPLTLIS